MHVMLLHDSAHFMNLQQLPSSLKSMGKRLRSVTCYIIRLSHTRELYNTSYIATDWAIPTMTLFNLTNFAHREMHSLPAMEKYSKMSMDGRHRRLVNQGVYLLLILKRMCNLTICAPTTKWQATVFRLTQKVSFLILETWLKIHQAIIKRLLREQVMLDLLIQGNP